VLAACEKELVRIINVDCGDKLAVASTHEFLSSLEFDRDAESNHGVVWAKVKGGGEEKRMSVELTMPHVRHFFLC
jgi:hypothetical protein